MMLKSKIFTISLMLTSCFFVAVYLFDLGYIFHGVRSTYLRGERSAQIDDSEFFYNNDVVANNPKKIPNAVGYEKNSITNKLNQLLEQTKSVAFLIVKDDSVSFEKYWDLGSVVSKTNSFSMAKSITSILVGCAIDDGFVGGVTQRVTDFFPKISSQGGEELKIAHLLQMSSGMEWVENYKRPLSVTARAYYGTNLKKLILGRRFSTKPGTVFHYKSGDTQLLGLVLERATGKSVADYAGERLWTRIGATNNALWSLDYNGGVEKVFCCFNSNARDFSKLGLLVLNDGILYGDTIVSSDYIRWMTSPVGLLDRSGEKTTHYSNSWYYAKVLDKEVIYARGFLGQYIVVIPEINLVFVRLGKKENKNGGNKNKYRLTADLEIIINEVINMYSVK
jgi:CubicO group peptidase (beta-lactamase class C family)